MPITEPGHGPLEALGPTVDVGDELIADVEERAAHLREVATGFRSGNPETALPGEPRPDYEPGRPLIARYESKAAELGVGVRTLRRWAADFGEAGLAHAPTEWRAALRMSQERAGLLGPRAETSDNPAAALATIRAPFPEGQAPDLGAHIESDPSRPIGGDDDDDEDLDDVSDEDYYADAFPVIE